MKLMINLSTNNKDNPKNHSDGQYFHRVYSESAYSTLYPYTVKPQKTKHPENVVPYFVAAVKLTNKICFSLN